MSHTTKSEVRMIARTRRIKGQLRAIERALEGHDENEDILQLVASCRGALNGIMAELIEGHLKFHVLPPEGQATALQLEAAERLALVVKRYFN